MTDIATLALAIKSDDVDRGTDKLDRLTAASKRAEAAAKGMGAGTSNAARNAAAANDNVARSADKVTAAYGKWAVVAQRVASALGAVAGALAVAALTRYADAWSDMQSRVGAAIRDMDAAPAMMQRLVDIANASYSPLDQTVEVYARNVSVLRDMGGTAKQAADFTEALNHALVITATRGERAASVQNALSKAMAVGKLQADGLETVLANGGAVAEALAAELGTTVNGLRKMATEGKITGNVIANSLIDRLGEFRDRAGEMPMTVGDAFVRIETNLTALVGQMDQSVGASEWLAEKLKLVADNLGTLARAATVAGATILVALAPTLLSQIAVGLGYIGAAGVAAIRAITVAMMANPLGLIAVAVSTALVALYQFRDEIRSVIGDDLFNAVKSAANFLINSFRAAFEDVKFVFTNLPEVIGGAIIGAINAVISAVNIMIDYTKGQINNLISMVNAIPLISMVNAIPGVGLPELDVSAPSISPLRNQPATNLSRKLPDHNAAIDAIMSTDNFAAGAQDVASSAGAAEDAVKRLNSAIDASGGKKTKAQKEAEKLANAYRDLIKGADDRIAQMKLEAEVAGLNGIAADTLRFKLDLLQKGEEKGRHLSAAQIAEIEKKAQAYQKYAEAAAKATLQQDLLFERAQLGRSGIDQTIASTLRGAGLEVDFDSYEAGLIRTNEQLKIGRDLSQEFAQGFVQDILNGESAMKALSNALGKFADKLIQMATDDLFAKAFGGAGAGGGGGGLLSGLLGIFGLGGGAAVSDPWGGLRMPTFAKGGIANQPSIISEFGQPEAAVPLPDGRRIPVDLRGGVANQNQQAPANQNVHVTIGWSRTADGNLKPFIESVSERKTSEQIAGFNQALPDRIQQINADPRKR